MWTVYYIQYNYFHRRKTFPDDCLNTVVSVAVISKSGFKKKKNIMTEIEKKKVWCLFELLLAWRREGRGAKEREEKKKQLLFYLKLLTSLNISATLTL